MEILLKPREVVEQVALALPDDYRKDVIIIGSLAAGYHYFGSNAQDSLRTKDVDCMISPHANSVVAAKNVTEGLIGEKWEYRASAKFPKPGTKDDPIDKLPIVRLHPPGQTEWFLELLTAPADLIDDDGNIPGRKLERFETKDGDFALCSFGFLALTEVDPVMSEYGLRIARPEMMALANLLHHPDIGNAVMEATFANRLIKRSNKDLGRVLALAYLADAAEEDSTSGWAAQWRSALAEKFPKQAAQLMERSCDGMDRLLESSADREEALWTMNNGLLFKRQLSDQNLVAQGKRFMADVGQESKKLAAFMRSGLGLL